MARTNTQKKDESFIQISDKAGEAVAFVNPARGYSKELIVDALVKKGLLAELKQPKEDKTSVDI